MAQLGQGQIARAKETFQKNQSVDALGASFGTSGLGDIASFEGRFSEAVAILTAGAAQDLAAKKSDRAAAKFAAVAFAELSRGQKRAAVQAAEKALANSKAVKIRFLAARTFVEAGEIAKAAPLVKALGSELQAEPQAYAKIVEADTALKNKDPRQAVKVLLDANSLFDTWIGHFDLGRAYLAVPALPQADAEFDRSIKHRGEALSLFLDEEPTYAYFPPVYYYQGRVREEMKIAGFADSYRTYLTMRVESKEDPLVPEVKKRTAR
jgi:tetratricopeptide (TPR) repeat protein